MTASETRIAGDTVTVVCPLTPSSEAVMVAVEPAVPANSAVASPLEPSTSETETTVGASLLQWTARVRF